MKFGFYDSCILISICLSGRKGACLKDIITYIDYADHSVITWQELKSGLHKLKRIGAIIEKKKSIYPTPKFISSWNKKIKNMKGHSVMDFIGEVNEYLDQTYAAFKIQPENVPTEIKKEDYHFAIKENR